ncbi:hypothetical protein HDEF_1171 [Candidatus Hamiltonella defensa 5AT (Acyrthosiphon pisum)]|uniref:Uncharacterized protein n=1 Tax=Hamiltonella defensa subsp. Acyrthosiphon pisum (strain 5AT) TaxID=572265 RepID=C4K5J0_HAMD5|nr:hypothetical protein HDEF_1171 [Candidatus Hamiltonella defensa 5AT (Acyrthosiphon pisum)]
MNDIKSKNISSELSRTDYKEFMTKLKSIHWMD